MKKTTQSVVTHQDAIHVLILIAICLWFCLAPAFSFGQPTLGLIGNDTFAELDSSFTPPPVTATTIPAQMPVTQTPLEVSAPAVSFPGTPAPPETPIAQREAPAPAVSEASPATANQYQQALPLPQQFSQPQTPQREVVVNVEHPFRQYWGIPNDPQTQISGKQMTVAELFSGTRSPAARNQLLQTYWELSGLLAIYHFRCEAERLANGTAGQQQDTAALLREQRRTAELEFIKQQWVLAELLKQYKGRTLRTSELPIPADFPLYPRYQTHADRIARTERTQYLGRMIPIQEQLIESKNGTWKAASEMVPSASQPFFTVSNLRTMAFLDLTGAIVEYNKMIAEYALETIPPNVSQQQLVGAVVRLTKSEAVLEQPQTLQMATAIQLTQYESPVEVPVQAVQQVGYEFREEYQPLPLQMATAVESYEESSKPAPAPPSFIMDF